METTHSPMKIRGTIWKYSKIMTLALFNNMTNNTFLSFHDFIMKITKFDRPIVVHTHVSIGTENKQQKQYLFL